MALELSSVDQIANHLRVRLGTDVDTEDITQALDAARDLISADVELRAEQAIPAALHRAGLLLAVEVWQQAQTVDRDDSTYIGGHGPLLMYNPVIKDLMRPYLKPRTGFATTSDGDGITRPIAGAGS